MPGRAGTLHRGRALCTAVLFLAAWTHDSSATPAPEARSGLLLLAESHARFGDRYQFETVAWSYAITNSGAAPVRITQAIALDGTGAVSVLPERIAPGESARIEVSQPLAAHLGAVAFRYAILTDEPGTPRSRFTLSGFVQSAYDPERPRLDFGILDRTHGGKAQATLASREVERLRIEGVEGAPAFLQVSWIDPSGESDAPVQLAATLKPEAPQGLLTGTLHLRTNVPHQPLVPVQFVAQVFADVVPQENPLPLGAIRIGETGTKRVRLVSRSGRAFRIAGVSDSAGPASPLAVTVRTCDGAPAPSTCQELELRLAPLATGPISGTIEVQIAGESDRLPLRYNALAIRPDAVIHQIEVPPASPPPEKLP